jgi:two-component system, OmpR family, response regulator
MDDADGFDPTRIENSSIRVLVLGPDSHQVHACRACLASHGIDFDQAEEMAAGVKLAARVSPDLILLDMSSAGFESARHCHWIRLRCDVPILAVTCRAEESERVLVLESGADDCLSQPLAMRELVARIRALVRRSRARSGRNGRVLQIGDLTIDPRSMRATLADRPLKLTTYEFKLLQGLAESAGRALAREQLMNLVRGTADEAFDRSVDSHVSRLRQKLGEDPRNPRIIKTVRGSGYILAPWESACDAGRTLT